MAMKDEDIQILGVGIARQGVPRGSLGHMVNLPVARPKEKMVASERSYEWGC